MLICTGNAKNVCALHTKNDIELREKVIGLFWLLINKMKSMPGITIIFTGDNMQNRTPQGRRNTPLPQLKLSVLALAGAGLLGSTPVWAQATADKTEPVETVVVTG